MERQVAGASAAAFSVNVISLRFCSSHSLVEIHCSRLGIFGNLGCLNMARKRSGAKLKIKPKTSAPARGKRMRPKAPAVKKKQQGSKTKTEAKGQRRLLTATALAATVSVIDRISILAAKSKI